MTMGMTSSQAYGEAWYWDKRYAQEPGPFDWYQKYASLAPLLRLYALPHHRILLVGCGNSSTSPCSSLYIYPYQYYIQQCIYKIMNIILSSDLSVSKMFSPLTFLLICAFLFPIIFLIYQSRSFSFFASQIVGHISFFSVI